MKVAFRLILLLAAFGAAIYFLGIRPRVLASTTLKERAESDGNPAVNLVTAQRTPAGTELVLPANLQSLQEAPIYARTDGYLAKLLVDLGDKVKAGQPLAIIDGPEVDQALQASRAALEQAKANYELAKSSSTRWQDLIKQNAVAQQEVDEKLAASAAREADVHAAEANVSRLTQLKQYQTIIAPFDGVISARNFDVGALISNGGSGRALFRLAQTGTLRVYINIPQTYFRSVTAGTPVDVLINEFPSKVFPGKVVRVAGALDEASRTLVTEVQIPNESGELLAGMFGQVRLKLTQGEPPLLIPSNAAVIRADGNFVETVDDANKLHIVKVRFGRDFGTQIEILSGLTAGAKVVANPRDSFTDGLQVSPVVPTPTPGPAAAPASTAAKKG
jgi:membrane fusion protein, multidrug efflux system